MDNWKEIFPKENRYFETNNGILYNGDSKEILKKFPKESIDLVVTDPPYGVNYSNNIYFNDNDDYVFNNLSIWLKQLHLILKIGSHFYLFIPTIKLDDWILNFKKFFLLNNVLAFQSYQTNIIYRNNFTFDLQLILYGSKGRAKEFNKVDWIPTSKQWLNDKRNKKKNKYVYKYPSFNKFYKANEKFNNFKKKKHPNQKSVTLIKNLIKISSNNNDIVLDPFIGSGTTAVACEKTGRRWIGIEIGKEYCEIAKKRILNLIK